MYGNRPVSLLLESSLLHLSLPLIHTCVYILFFFLLTFILFSLLGIPPPPTADHSVVCKHHIPQRRLPDVVCWSIGPANKNGFRAKRWVTVYFFTLKCCTFVYLLCISCRSPDTAVRSSAKALVVIPQSRPRMIGDLMGEFTFIF